MSLGPGLAAGAVRREDSTLAAFGEGALAAEVPRKLVTVPEAVDIGDAFVELEHGYLAQRSRDATGPNFMAGSHVVAEIEEAAVSIGTGNNEGQQVRAEYGLDHRVAGNGLRLAGGHVGSYDLAEF